MKKLFALKEWLTLEQAALHLAGLFDEPVTVADVLRLGLDGRLILSVHFVNSCQARRAEFIGEADRTFWEAEIPGVETFLPALAGKAVRIPREAYLGDGKYLRVEKGEILTLDGVFDLVMLGSERLDVEHMFQIQTGGPGVEMINMEGALVRRDGVICQIVHTLSDLVDTNAKSGMPIAEGDSASNALRIAESMTHDQNKRTKGWKPLTSQDYFPQDGLPRDSRIVVRTQALREFESSVAESGTGQEPKRKSRDVAEMQAYRDTHTIEDTAHHFGISATLLKRETVGTKRLTKKKPSLFPTVRHTIGK